MQRMQGMVDTVARGETTKSGLKQTPSLGLQEDGSTKYYHGKGYGTVSKSGKLLSTSQDGKITHTQDAKEIAHYIALREAEAKKKEEQDFAREVNEANPTQKEIDAQQYEPPRTDTKGLPDEFRK